MTDDIVTRLRDLAMKEESPWANIYDHVMRESADEIERLRNELAEQTIIHEVQKTNTLNEIDRLRAERDKWRNVADGFATTHRHRLGLDGAWDSVNLAYDRAVRGE